MNVPSTTNVPSGTPHHAPRREVCPKPRRGESGSPASDGASGGNDDSDGVDVVDVMARRLRAAASASGMETLLPAAGGAPDLSACGRSAGSWRGGILTGARSRSPVEGPPQLVPGLRVLPAPRAEQVALRPSIRPRRQLVAPW